MDKKSIQKQGIIPFKLIRKSVHKIAEMWGIKYIPLNTLEEIINPIRKRINEMNVNKEIIDHYNLTLDELYKACEKQAKRMGSKNVPLAYLDEAINHLIKAYKEGFEKLYKN